MRILLVFLLGAVVGILGWRFYEQRQGEGSSAFSGLAAWHLTPAEVRADLARTGEVVREKAQSAGSEISDVRIVAVIKAKYVLDRSLSAGSIRVESHQGFVFLDGTVPSADLIGRAVKLALDTDGVRRVTARLTASAGG